MAYDTFPRALAAVLVHEGGFVHHPRDPGGATNKGITIATFRKWVKRNGTVADLKAISDSDVAKVYRRHYWDKVRASDLPPGVDYAVFDFAVNSGPVRAAKELQRAIGAKVDGIVGPETIAKAAAADAAALIGAICYQRLLFLRSLKTWETFGKGWARRVAGVSALALKIAQETPQPVPATPIPSEPSLPRTDDPAGNGAPSNARGWLGILILALSAIGAAVTAGWGWISNFLGF